MVKKFSDMLRYCGHEANLWLLHADATVLITLDVQEARPLFAAVRKAGAGPGVEQEGRLEAGQDRAGVGQEQKSEAKPSQRLLAGGT